MTKQRATAPSASYTTGAGQRITATRTNPGARWGTYAIAVDGEVVETIRQTGRGRFTWPAMLGRDYHGYLNDARLLVSAAGDHLIPPMTARATAIIASLRDQRLDVALGIITRAEFDRRIALTEEGGVAVPDNVKAPIVRIFPHLVAVAEAIEAGTVEFGEEVAIGKEQWFVTGADGAGIVIAPAKGGRCYEVAYCLGDGREAILRTAAMRGEMHTADVGHGEQRVFIPGRTEQDEADR